MTSEVAYEPGTDIEVGAGAPRSFSALLDRQPVTQKSITETIREEEIKQARQEISQLQSEIDRLKKEVDKLTGLMEQTLVKLENARRDHDEALKNNRSEEGDMAARVRTFTHNYETYKGRRKDARTNISAKIVRIKALEELIEKGRPRIIRPPKINWSALLLFNLVIGIILGTGFYFYRRYRKRRFYLRYL